MSVFSDMMLDEEELDREDIPGWERTEPGFDFSRMPDGAVEGAARDMNRLAERVVREFSDDRQSSYDPSDPRGVSYAGKPVPEENESYAGKPAQEEKEGAPSRSDRLLQAAAEVEAEGERRRLLEEQEAEEGLFGRRRRY